MAAPRLQYVESHSDDITEVRLCSLTIRETILTCAAAISSSAPQCTIVRLDRWTGESI